MVWVLACGHFHAHIEPRVSSPPIVGVRVLFARREKRRCPTDEICVSRIQNHALVLDTLLVVDEGTGGTGEAATSPTDAAND